MTITISKLAALGVALGMAFSALPALADVSGNFEGRSNHVTGGTASIVEDGGTYYVVLGADFSLDNGPDPRVALGNDGYDASTQLGALISLNGVQRYAIPASIDVSNYDQVWIWCEAASVPLGVAELN